MKTLLLLAMTMAFALLQTHGDLLQFWKMIHLLTGREPVFSYAFYGCYCGFGGKGSPKDATDWCCATHDCCCYDWLAKRGCGTTFLRYKHEYESRNTQILGAKQDYGRRQLCQCDKVAAFCFARNQKTYNKKYQYYNKQCTGKALRC